MHLLYMQLGVHICNVGCRLLSNKGQASSNIDYEMANTLILSNIFSDST